MEYRQRIEIGGRNISDILSLPCIRGCEKTSVAGIYDFSFYPLSMAFPSAHRKAQTGDVLCEDHGGKWHVIRNGKEL